MSIYNKKAYLEHQKRDLPCCHPSERDGRLLEISELEKEIAQMEAQELEAQKTRIKVSRLGNRGNSCNFCFTDNGLAHNVNEIQGYQIIIRICDECLEELNKQRKELLERET